LILLDLSLFPFYCHSSTKVQHNLLNAFKKPSKELHMKIIVRAFVVVLALTGAAASTQTPTASASTIVSASMRSSAMPVPTCPPDGSTNCGILGGK